MAGPATASCSATTGSMRTNYARIGHAAQQVLPEILQNILTTKEPQSKLHSDVSSNQFLSRNLRADEWSMINNARTHGYANFDMPLIYKLIRNLNLVPPPTQGWDYRLDPTPREVTTGDDIERIRRVRNKIIHRGNANVSDTDLENYFTLFKDIAQRLEHYLGKPQDEFIKTITELENCSMDESKEQIYLERLEMLKKREEDLSKAVERLREDVDFLMNEDFNSVTLEEWQEQNKYFVRTDAVDAILESLEKNHVFCVTGISGVGKSASIHHIALCLRDTQGFQIRSCYHKSEISKFYKKKNLQVFVFDDICGKYTLLQRDVEEWIKLEASIQRIMALGNMKILATCRSQIFREPQFQRIRLFTEQSFDLSSDKFSLSNDMKLQIAKQYLPENVLDGIKGELGKYEFLPLMFALYKKLTKTSTIDDAKTFFKNPFEKYIDEMNKLKEAEDKTKFCSLFLFVMNNGFIELSMFTEEESLEVRNKRESFFEACGIPRNTVRKRLLEQLDSLIGLFLTKHIRLKSSPEFLTKNIGLKSSPEYTTIHDKTFDFLCFYFGTHLQEPFIQYADSKVISQRTQLASIKKTKEEFTVLIDKENEKDYFKRIINDLSLAKVSDVMYNRQMRYAKFRFRLIAYMKHRLDKESMKRIIFLCDNNKYSEVEFTNKDDGFSKSLDQTTLNLSFKLGYTDVIEFFLTFIDVSNSETFAFLMRKAIHSKYYTVVSLMLDKGIDVNIAHGYNNSFLFTACLTGDIALIRLLVGKGADVNSENDNYCPLITACGYHINNRYKIVELLLNEGANPNICKQIIGLSLTEVGSLKGFTLNVKITKARCFGYDRFRLCLDERGVKYPAVDNNNLNPLRACFLCDEEVDSYSIVELLLDKGANVNFVDIYGFSQLAEACRLGVNLNIIKLLIERGADINPGNNSSSIHPLLAVCERDKDKYEIIEFLLDKGANVNTVGQDGDSPLIKICIQKDFNCVKLLLERGADVNFNNMFLNRSPLKAICDMKPPTNFRCYKHYRYYPYKIIKLLLDKGASIENFGNSFLTSACIDGEIALAKMLIERGADIDFDTYFRYVLDMCYFTDPFKYCPSKMSENMFEIVQLLVKKGANVNTVNGYEETISKLAFCHGDIRVVKLLMNTDAVFDYKIMKSTLLILVCQCDNNNLDRYRIIEQLLDKNTNMITVQTDGQLLPPTYFNRDSSKLGGLQKKIETDVKANHDNLNQTPLTSACSTDNKGNRDELSVNRNEIVKLLLDEEANINYIDKDEKCPLSSACVSGDINLV